MEFFQPLVLLCFFLNTHVVPSFNDTVLGFLVVHEGIADGGVGLVRLLLKKHHSVSYLSSLVLGEKQNLICSLNEHFLLRP